MVKMESNVTLLDQIKFDINEEAIDPGKSSFWFFFLALTLFIVWVVFITFYLSRVVGLIISFLLNRYLRLSKSTGHVKVGSFSISLLGGKIMFREFVYATDDYCLRINDGWIIYSYWKPIPGKKVDLNEIASRLHVSLNGFQLHWYNRVDRYKEIAKLFGFEKYFGYEEARKPPPPDATAPGERWDRMWALIGIIRFDVWSGRMVVGNKQLPYMFELSWENLTSKIKLNESANDRALLSFEGQMESVKGSFLKHPEYEGKPYKDAPRTMGDGFALLQSAHLQFFYHQDILGFVTQEVQNFDDKATRPVWESILRFGGNTVFSYGPWAEQQRALLHAFFFPPDYQSMPVSEPPKHGKRRVYVMHDVRVSLLKESSIDLWFNRGDQLETMHNRCQPGSTVDMSIWWVTRESGFSWWADFSLLNVVSTSSLVYRKLFECETLKVHANFDYPRVFNAEQTWKFDFQISKATMWFVWDHKRFFTDLINEWVGDQPADLLAFIPYKTHISMDVSDSFEVIMILNEGNWVDTAEMQSENIEMAVVGQKLSLSFILPFVDFLPETTEMKYSFLGTSEVALRVKYPPSSATSSLLGSLLRNARTTINADPSTRGSISLQEGWQEIWRSERISMDFDYKQHPFNPEVRCDIPLHVMQEWLPPKAEHPFDLSPDSLHVAIDIEGSEIYGLGLIIKLIMDLKNNYFGWYDTMTDVSSAATAMKIEKGQTNPTVSMFDRVPANALPELYRPMNATVELRVHNIRAQIPVYSPTGPELLPVPVFMTEEVAFQMIKTPDEMKMQVGCGRCVAHFERSAPNRPDGFLTLSSLQVRGQALLSPVEVPWDMAILEYGWMVEVLIGDIAGSLDFPTHVSSLHQFAETTLLFLLSKDDEKVIPARFDFCQHGQLVQNCKKTTKAQCEGEESMKYRNIRVSVDGVNLALLDERAVVQIDVDPVRVILCNAHEGGFMKHLSIRLPQVSIRHAVRFGESTKWLEAASILIEGVQLDLDLPLSEQEYYVEKERFEFLKKHDKKTGRLLFLKAESTLWNCGCYGKTKFFADVDTLGASFLSNSGPTKLCVPAINVTGQPGYHQDMFKKDLCMMRPGEPHYVYATKKSTIPEVDTRSTLPSLDTGSFHSAVSQQKDGRPSQSRNLMSAYSTYLTEVELSRTIQVPPKLGEVGSLSEWALGLTVAMNTKSQGMNEVEMFSSGTQIPLHEVMSSEAAGALAIAKDLKDKIGVPNCLTIKGSAAQAVEVFVTPLAIESIEMLVQKLTRWLPNMNPGFLLQSTYLECALKNHRQPLTENLFPAANDCLKVEVSVELPRLHLAMFQNCCIENPIISASASDTTKVGTMESPSTAVELDRHSNTSANMAFILFNRSNLCSANLTDPNVDGQSFSLTCSVVSSQIVQLVSKSNADFSASRAPFSAEVEWHRAKIAQRIDKELRVVVDVRIPDVSVAFENRIRKKPKGTENLASIPSPGDKKTKISIGCLRSMIVMARPMERTGKYEFPIYDIFNPTINAWLQVSQRLDNAVTRLKDHWNQWSDMSFARIMKLALDCTDEKILGVRGKNVMEAVKVLGKHQSGCPSCLLLHILLRWCALPDSPEQLKSPLQVRTCFETAKTRKMALMALLSHWHSDISQTVKLTSHEHAARFRADPAQVRREVHIDMGGGANGGTTDVRTHRRTGSAASRNLARTDDQKRPSEAGTGGVKRKDLYGEIMSFHREREARKKKKGTASERKDYVNPMDVLPQAFFFVLYKNRHLDWSNLDNLPLTSFKFAYDVAINGVAVDLVEPKLMPSSDSHKKLLAPCLHHLMQIKRVAANGDLSWSMEMDEKNLVPLNGRVQLTYLGAIEDVQFVVAISSVCLAKEVGLVVKSAINSYEELKKEQKEHRTNATTPMSACSTISARSTSAISRWDDKVFDMMRDFEKSVYGLNTVPRGDVFTSVRGQVQIDDIRLESKLTDLYISFDMKTIDVVHEHNPGTKNCVANEVDILRISLRKSKLNIRESLSNGVKVKNEFKSVLYCSLKESSATLVRKLVVVEGLSPRIDTSLAISLGAIEGELPMAAHNLHDVVMRHGPQLEMELDRISAQPLSIPQSQTVVLDTAEVDIEGPLFPRPKEGTAPRIGVQQTPVAKIAFSFKLECIELKARLLPSLMAIYKLKNASSTGLTGSEAHWQAAIEDHFAEFHVSAPGKPSDFFTLLLPSVNVNGQYLGEDDERDKLGNAAPATDKQLHFRKGGYLKIHIALGKVSHTFTTDLLNHILLAEQTFRTELSSLMQRLSAQKPGYSFNSANPAPPASDKAPLLFFLTIRGTSAPREPWLQLTAATPSSTAVRFTIDTLETELTNRWVVKEEGTSKERFFGCAVIQFNAKLGQLVKAAQYEEIQAELQEYATFMTQIRVENKESSKQTYSYHIALNRPILLLKSSAIDKAILLWLNYKNTYDYWRTERSKFERSSQKRHSIPQAMFSPQPAQEFDINLSLAINNGMYVCMPLISHDVTDGMPALVLSLLKSDVTVSIKRELACQAQFHGFKLSFINNFDEQSLLLEQNATTATGDVQSNFFYFPQGSYKLCSKAAQGESGDADWVLSVRSHMKGMTIDLDQKIGKLSKMLVNTFSSLVDDDEMGHMGSHFDYELTADEKMLDEGKELNKLQPEERIRWMERKMHEQSQLVCNLVLKKAAEKDLETARRKLRQYELIRFKEFRRSMADKWKKKNVNDKKEGTPAHHSQARRKSSAVDRSAFPLPQEPTQTSSHEFSDEAGNKQMTATSSTTKDKENTVNMHIDVQVSIEQGSCILRTAPKQDQSSLIKRPSAKDLRAKNIISPVSNFTKFSIPGVEVKGYYASAGAGNANLFSKQFAKAAVYESNENLPPSFQKSKRGCFYLSIALSSMPSDTVVTPHLADFLEQVLEPLPVTIDVPSTSVESLPEQAEAMNNIVAMDTSVLPFDVLFYLIVQSSTIKFDGQQQRSSAADCLLKLPSLTLMCSTRRRDDSEYVGSVDISATLSAFSLSIYSPHQQSTAHDALSLTLDHLSLVISRSKNPSIEQDNRVRFVLTSNIGTANFNYDMRRLSELMAFPKPWYRRAIARRVFFGDQTVTRTPAPSKPSTIASHNVEFKLPTTTEIVEKPWSATVLLAVQWKDLNINAQMSNTMGTTSWIVRKGLLRSFAKVNSRHERDVTLTFQLDGSDLNAHGGAISGEISLNKLGISASHKATEKKPPVTRAHVEILSVGTKIEWMSRAVLIGRCEKPSISLGDEFVETMNENKQVNRAAVSLHVKGAWEDLQIVITKNTIEDMQKIASKLQSFFQEQLKSSKMVWQFASDADLAGQQKTVTEGEEPEEEVKFVTKHWEKVLDMVTDIQYSLGLLALPKSGETVVGGSVELEAGKCSLACMHGEMNATSWAVFHLRQPTILFAPEAQFYYADRVAGTIGVSVRQRLIIRLGNVPTSSDPAQTENMANVSRVQQGRNSVMRQNAPIGASLDYLIGDVLKQLGLSGPPSTPTGPATTKTQHSVLELFQFPALEAVLTSLQNNECEAAEDSLSAELKSSFLCEFHSAVYVQTDFNAQITFLPELLKSYIKVDEPTPAPGATSSSALVSVDAPPPKTDRRIYVCENWVVDPKIRFIDRFKWNPPVIDEVLRKLQIFDHRTTIPKALQRALLDPLDVILANSLCQMLKLVNRTEIKAQNQKSQL